MRPGCILRKFGVAQDEASDPVQPIDGATGQDAECLVVSASRPVDECRLHVSLQVRGNRSGRLYATAEHKARRFKLRTTGISLNPSDVNPANTTIAGLSGDRDRGEGSVTKSELVELARDGDRDAYDVLMTQVIDHLYRIARLILRDFDSAEDAVQEALVRCWRDLPRLREADRFDAWLNRILLHAVTDEARRRRGFNANVTRLRIEPAQPDSTKAIVDRDELARAFDRLSIEHRTIVVLHHYLGLTVDQAATTIGIPVGTAKSRLHYGTEALRAALEAAERGNSAGKAMA
jgi:RNA polymerase sigma-70 factor, ECF subfamily